MVDNNKFKDFFCKQFEELALLEKNFEEISKKLNIYLFDKYKNKCPSLKVIEKFLNEENIFDFNFNFNSKNNDKDKSEIFNRINKIEKSIECIYENDLNYKLLIDVYEEKDFEEELDIEKCKKKCEKYYINNIQDFSFSYEDNFLKCMSPCIDDLITQEKNNLNNFLKKAENIYISKVNNRI